jgi:lactoylglutathione lyase
VDRQARHLVIREDDLVETAADRPDGTPGGVRELRLAVTAEDWEAAVTFYRDELGLRQLDDFSSDRGRVVLLDAGRATLELVDADQAAFIDQVEVGRRVAGHIRVAFQVDDVGTSFHRLVSAGGESIAVPTRTPWNSLNARLQAPAGLQLTLFEEPTGADAT